MLCKFYVFWPAENKTTVLTRKHFLLNYGLNLQRKKICWFQISLFQSTLKTNKGFLRTKKVLKISPVVFRSITAVHVSTKESDLRCVLDNCCIFLTSVRAEFYPVWSVLFPPLHRSADGYERDHGEAHAWHKVPQWACHRAEGDHRRQREQGSVWLRQRVQVSDVSVNDDGPENVLQEMKWWLEFQTKELHVLQRKTQTGLMLFEKSQYPGAPDGIFPESFGLIQRSHQGGKALKVIGRTHCLSHPSTPIQFVSESVASCLASHFWFHRSRMKLIG